MTFWEEKYIETNQDQKLVWLLFIFPIQYIAVAFKAESTLTPTSNNTPEKQPIESRSVKSWLFTRSGS